MKKFITLMVVTALVLTMFVGCSNNNANTASDDTEKTADQTTVGFIYVGPVGDGGWTFAHVWTC